MFYNEKYTKENAVKLMKKRDAMDVDIYHLDDPEEPYIVWRTKTSMNPFRYHTYNEETVTITKINKTQSAVDISSSNWSNNTILLRSLHAF